MFLYIDTFRRRRSPSPVRRRRSPSPPRRRRSPSPPRRRYCCCNENSHLSIVLKWFALQILLFSGLLPLLRVVGLRLPGVILLLSSVATAPHLCPHRRGSCLIPPQNAFLLVQSGAPPGRLNVEVLLLSGDVLLPPLFLLRDTGGARCLPGQAGTLDPLLDLLDASPGRRRTAVALLGDPLVPKDAFNLPACLRPTSEDSCPLHRAVNSSAGCLAPQSHGINGTDRKSFHPEVADLL